MLRFPSLPTAKLRDSLLVLAVPLVLWLANCPQNTPDGIAEVLGSVRVIVD
jgi:hypothetical protein